MPTLYVVATPIGNLSDMTPRAIETLSHVSLIAAEDTSHTVKLLNYFDIKTPMISYHKYNESERSVYIISKMLNEGIDVAIVTDAGTPCVSDPGYDLILSARQNGITVIGIPGACAAVTALSISGFPSDTFCFIGFLKRDKKEQIKQLEALKDMQIDSFIIYESPFRLISTLENINETLPSCKVCVCNDITKLHEYSVSGDIGDVLTQMNANENVEKGEYVIILHNEYSNTEPKNKLEEQISLEAMIVDIMIKKDCTAKAAVNELHKLNPDYGKKEIYAASLRLKEMFGE